eukprot:XP_001698381.1 predicted protein [Chlamydomonas reinhardtii]
MPLQMATGAGRSLNVTARVWTAPMDRPLPYLIIIHLSAPARATPIAVNNLQRKQPWEPADAASMKRQRAPLHEKEACC